MNSTNSAENSADQKLDSYDYTLPKELIAQRPVTQRTASRMMVVHRKTGKIEHFQVRDLPQFLAAGDAVVVNDSKVLPARLIGYRTQTRGRWEGLFLRSDDTSGLADLLCKTRGRMEIGETVTLQDLEGREPQKLTLLSQQSNGHATFRCEPETNWTTVMEQCGRVPLPPYIRDGQMSAEDIERYQTVYARRPGSVAAPTAGLHFTPELITAVRGAGAAFVTTTLHVGVGTFRPIATEVLGQHQMHSEWCELSEPVARRLQNIRSEGGRVLAVGTTSVRTLESAARNNNGQLQAWAGNTDLFIRPGFEFQATDLMLTNFHLPKSSLLVLVSAFASRELILQAYNEAVEQEYRFYSYGDCMLIL